MLYYVLVSPPPLWGQEARGQAGSKGSEMGARGSERSKTNVILGFRVPTTSGRKNFDDDTYCLCVPRHLEVQSQPNVHSHSHEKVFIGPHHGPKILGQKLSVNH